MKILLFAILILQALNMHAQTVDIPFIFYDGANTNTDLHVGLDSTATYGIDYNLGEFPVPIFLPPTGLLQLWFFLDSLELATYRDYRYAPSFPYSGSSVHMISGFLSSGANEFIINYDFPQGVSANVKDIYGGTIFNQDLSGSGTYSFPSNYLPMVLTMFYDNVIPVELFSFTAEFNTTSVELKWSTASETNNRGFEVERFQRSEVGGQRSEVGSQKSGWVKIGYVQGSGTTTVPKSYSFTDGKVTSGIYEYRLKQIDFDGSFKYSKAIEVEVNLIPAKFILEQNYPNPFNPLTMIKFGLPEATNVSLVIYNSLGQKVTELVNSKLEAGSYEYQWNAKDFASGIYIYELKTGEFISIKKMILLK